MKSGNALCPLFPHYVLSSGERKDGGVFRRIGTTTGSGTINRSENSTILLDVLHLSNPKCIDIKPFSIIAFGEASKIRGRLGVKFGVKLLKNKFGAVYFSSVILPAQPMKQMV